MPRDQARLGYYIPCRILTRVRCAFRPFFSGWPRPTACVFGAACLFTAVMLLICRHDSARRSYLSEFHWCALPLPHFASFLSAAAAMDLPCVSASSNCPPPRPSVAVALKSSVCTGGSPVSALDSLRDCPPQPSFDETPCHTGSGNPLHAPADESLGTLRSRSSRRPPSDASPLFSVRHSAPLLLSRSAPAWLPSDLSGSRPTALRPCKDWGQGQTQMTEGQRHPLASGCSAGVPCLPSASLFVLYTFPEELDGLLFDPTVQTPSRQPCSLPPPPPYSLSDPVTRPVVRDGRRVAILNGDGASEPSHPIGEEAPRYRPGQRHVTSLPSDTPPVSSNNNTDLRKTPSGACDPGPSFIHNSSTHPSFPSSSVSDSGGQPIQCSSVILLSRWTRYADVVAAFKSKDGAPPLHVKSPQHNARLAPSAGEKYLGSSVQSKLTAQPCMSFHGPGLSPPFPPSDGVTDITASGHLLPRHSSADPHLPMYTDPTMATTAQPPRPLGTIMQSLDRLCPAELILLASRLQTRLPVAVRAVLADDYGKSGRDRAVTSRQWDSLSSGELLSMNTQANGEPLPAYEQRIGTQNRGAKDGTARVSNLKMHQTVQNSFSLVSREPPPPDLGVFAHPVAPAGLPFGDISGQQSILHEGGAFSGPATLLHKTNQHPKENFGQKPLEEDELVADAMEELERQLVHLQLRTEASPSPLRPRSSRSSPLGPPSCFPAACQPGDHLHRVTGGKFGMQQPSGPARVTSSSSSPIPIPLPPPPMPALVPPNLSPGLLSPPPAPLGLPAVVPLPPGRREVGGCMFTGAWYMQSQSDTRGVACEADSLAIGMSFGHRQGLPSALPGVQRPEERESMSREESGGGKSENSDFSSSVLPGAADDTVDELKLMQSVGLPTQFGRAPRKKKEGSRDSRRKKRSDNSTNCGPNDMATVYGVGAQSAYCGNAFLPSGSGGEAHSVFTGATVVEQTSRTALTLTDVTKPHPCDGFFQRRRRRGDGQCGCGEMADMLLEDTPVEMEGDERKTECDHTYVGQGQRNALGPTPSASYDQVGNGMASSYYRLRYELFHNYDDGILFDENAWYETTLESIAGYLATELRRVAVRSKNAQYEQLQGASVCKSSITSQLPPECRPSAGVVSLGTRPGVNAGLSTDAPKAAPLQDYADHHSLEVTVDAQKATVENEDLTTVSPVSVRNPRTKAMAPSGDLPGLHSHPKYTSHGGETGVLSGGRRENIGEMETLAQRSSVSFSTPRGGLPDKPLYAMDGCCGAGGNLIQFARYFDACIGVDCDLVKVAICKHNASVCGVADKVYVHHNTLAGWLFERQKARQKARQSTGENPLSPLLPSRPPSPIFPSASKQRRFTGEASAGSQLCWCSPEFSHLKCRFCRALPPGGELPLCWGKESTRASVSASRGQQEKLADSVVLPGGHLRVAPAEVFSRPSACRLPTFVPTALPTMLSPLASSLKSSESLTADISWCFMSPPWSGPTYSGRRAFHSQLFSISGCRNGGGGVGSAHIPSLVKTAARIAPNVCLYLPRSTNVHELAALAVALGFPLLEVEVLYSHFIDPAGGRNQKPTLFPKAVIAYFVRDVAAWISTRGLPAGKSSGKDTVLIRGADSGKANGSSNEEIAGDPTKVSLSARAPPDGIVNRHEMENFSVKFPKKHEDGQQFSTQSSTPGGHYVTFRDGPDGSTRKPAFGMWPLEVYMHQEKELSDDRASHGASRGRQNSSEDLNEDGLSYECRQKSEPHSSPARGSLSEQNHRRQSVDSPGDADISAGVVRRKHGQIQDDGCMKNLSLFWSAVARAIDAALRTPLVEATADNMGPRKLRPGNVETVDMENGTPAAGPKSGSGRSRTYTEVLKSDLGRRETGNGGSHAKVEASKGGAEERGDLNTGQGKTTTQRNNVLNACHTQHIDVAALLRSGALSLEEVLAALAMTEEEIPNKGLLNARSTFRRCLSTLMRRD
ncbi:rna cap guanine-n2 methyltransferase [Cystoisospora suis]|uniref:Trimethylguanosine synthase n=1 Tax=Cystoisospora suis TaxID=483139 RepID=A0A2C6JXE4_9APIC|nr:rna cap guanine-n2 methyltransferase [Cystoisospora suis]